MADQAQGLCVAVVGAGEVGRRVVRELVTSPGVTEVVVDAARERVAALSASFGPRVVHAAAATRAPVVTVLATPEEDHPQRARRLLAAGSGVVSVSGAPGVAAALMDLDAQARAANRAVIPAAAFAPGLSSLLAEWASRRLPDLDEVHVAVTGTAGPACRAAAAASLEAVVREWRDGGWEERSGGSGGEQRWFPEPVGAVDCVVASSAEAAMLLRRFPGLTRVTHRRARLSRTPRLHRGQPDRPGAIVVEARGTSASGRTSVVLGVLDRPAHAAAATAAVTALSVVRDGVVGARSLAEAVDPTEVLIELARRGVRAAILDPAV